MVFVPQAFDDEGGSMFSEKLQELTKQIAHLINQVFLALHKYLLYLNTLSSSSLKSSALQVEWKRHRNLSVEWKS